MLFLHKKTDLAAKFSLALLICLFFVYALGVPAVKAENDVVNIPDENLEAAIRDEIDMPEGDILPEAMESLTVLSVTGEGIEDLTGLEYAKSLERLYLSNNQVSNLLPLEELVDLQRLNLDSNQISDISPLEGLTGIEQLWLRYNDIDNISALANMTGIERIFLSGNQVSDINPLQGLTGLIELLLDDNQVSDVSAISGMTNLVRLSLEGNQVSDISALSGLSGLSSLSLNDNQINDITGLNDLTGLRRLRLAENEISDISALSGLTGLTELTLRYNYLDLSEESEAMIIINDLIAGGTDVEYEPQKDIEEGPNDDPVPNGDPVPHPDGIIESAVVDVDGGMVEISLGDYATAHFEGTGNAYFDYLSGAGDFMLVYAIRSGDKYIAIAEYAEQYFNYDDMSDALENAEHLPELEVNEFLQLIGFEEDGSPVFDND